MSKHLLAKTICIAALVIGCLFVILPVYGQQGDTQVSVPSLDVLILVDESGTMRNYTDPEGKRIQAVNLFMDQLSLLAPRTGSHRVGIIAFGTEPKVIHWTFLNSGEDADRIGQEYQAAQDAFSRQSGSKYTDINKALAKALEIMKAEHEPARKPALILISDGQPFLPSNLEEQGKPAVEAYLQETQKLIDEFRAVSYSGSLCPTSNGMPLFMLAVGTNVLPKEGASTLEFVDLYKGFWQGMSDSTGGYYEEIEPFDEIGSAVTEVFARLLCGVICPLGEKFENAQEFPFTVEEEYGQILFVISGKDNPAITSKVFRPGQEDPIQPDDKVIKWIGSADYDVWSIERSEPWAGTWRVALEGEGTAYFKNIASLASGRRGFFANAWCTNSGFMAYCALK